MTTPRAAAVAGILFSVLLIISLVLIRISVPADPQDAGAWLAGSGTNVALALNLLPFAGIAFLWFIGVVRDRLGEYEDRLFSTVFLGSGLLFLAMLFASAAMAGGVITAFQTMPQQIIDTGLYGFGRAVTYELMNTYTMKMAGVFMISSLHALPAPGARCRVGWRTSARRWRCVLLLSIGFISWIALVFPLWTLLISVYILIQNYRRKAAPAVS